MASWELRTTPAALGRRVCAIAVVLVVMSVFPPAAESAETGTYAVPYADDICFQHEHGSIVRRSVEVTCVHDQGRPTAATEYLKHPSTDTIFAVLTDIENFPSVTPVSRALTYEQWEYAGFPAPRVVTEIPGALLFYKWAYSDEVFSETPEGLIRKLTVDEWAAYGYPTPRLRTSDGYAKLSWSPGVAYMYSIATGHGRHLTPAEWAAAAYPTPQVVQRFAGDVFCRALPPRVDIRYYGPTHLGTVTTQQWEAAGSPELAPCP